MLLSLSDDDVLELLAALGVDPEECTPDQRRKLLRLALQQAQASKPAARHGRAGCCPVFKHKPALSR